MDVGIDVNGDDPVDPEAPGAEDENAAAEEDAVEELGGQVVVYRAELAQPAERAGVQINNFFVQNVIQGGQLPAQGAPVHEVAAGAGGNGDLAGRVTALEGQVRELQSQNRAQTRCMFLTVTVGVLTTLSTGLGIYFSMKSLVSGGNGGMGEKAELTADLAIGKQSATSDAAARSLGDPNVIAQEVIDKLGADGQKLVDAWNNTSEADFWQMLANFVTAKGPRSWEEQLLFCQYVQDISAGAMTTLYVWHDAADKVAMVDAATDVITTQGLAAMYEHLPTLTYQPVGGSASAPLPRAVAANIGSLAISAWKLAQPLPSAPTGVSGGTAQ
jgi:hypothetical protein